MSAPVIMWFRRDLRLADNEALAAAIAPGGAVVPVYIEHSGASGDASGPIATRLPRRACRAWLAASLGALDASLRERGSRLLIAEGPAAVALTRLAREIGAGTVTCTRDWTPAAMAEETAVADALREAGARLDVHEGQLVAPPPALRTGEDRAYRVFTPYHRAWERSVGATAAGATVLPVPGAVLELVGTVHRVSSIHDGVLPPPDTWPESLPLPAAPPGAPGAGDRWTPGERGARARLAAFVREDLATYADAHDRADLDGTSRLSAHLAFGEISVREVISTATSAAGAEKAAAFVRQLVWREFAYHVLHAFPALVDAPLQQHFSAMPWADDAGAADAWRAGATGYPLVDAGMRELAETGWMHNRARLVSGSFLTKHLLVQWQEGAAHFEEALLDSDTAVNAFNWQWVAGSGADAAPYFRIFNPALQGAKVDPSGTYVRAWVPELAGVPDRWLHRPYEAPADVLADAGVVLGKTYPRPIIEHATARERALAAYEVVKAARRG